MTDVAIQVRGLSKSYRIGQSGWLRRRRPEDTVWALRDVSFDVHAGEVLGIVGRNGAGKSTLLRILSRITEPDSGQAEIHGRVGSLLEVGTGFHPELTGRENIFLNGAILGMKRAEIKARFDEIADFSGVERFLDTPVKRYSSGMYMRLAFAVAAHLDTEIILVDEVLAVGDAEFQKKCLGKMTDIAKGGRTVLFISHNMAAVGALCHRAILLYEGRQIMQAAAPDVVRRYMEEAGQMDRRRLADRTDRRGNGALRFTDFRLLDDAGQPLASAAGGSAATLAFRYTSPGKTPLRGVNVCVVFYGRVNEPIAGLSTNVCGKDFAEAPQEGEFRCHVPRMPLQPGVYTFHLICSVGDEMADCIQHAGRVDVITGDFFGTGRTPPPEQGPFLIDYSWSLDRA